VSAHVVLNTSGYLPSLYQLRSADQRWRFADVFWQRTRGTTWTWLLMESVATGSPP